MITYIHEENMEPEETMELTNSERHANYNAAYLGEVDDFTDEEILDTMSYIAEHADPESGHIAADRLICEVLLRDGHEALVSVYNSVRKWYS